MKKLLTLLLILISLATYSQSSYQYSYIEPCSGKLKSLTVPIGAQGSNVTVNYFGYVNTFNSVDFNNGVFQSWMNNIAGNNTGRPCDQIATILTNNINMTVTQNVITTVVNVASITNMMSDVLSDVTGSAMSSNLANALDNSENSESSSGSSSGSANGGSANGGSNSGSSSTNGGSTTGGSNNGGGSTTSGSTTSGSTTSGSTTSGSTTGGSTTSGSTTSGSTTSGSNNGGGSTTSGSSSTNGSSTTGGSNNGGGSTTSGSTNGTGVTTQGSSGSGSGATANAVSNAEGSSSGDTKDDKDKNTSTSSSSGTTSVAVANAEENSGGDGGKGNKSEKKTGSMIGTGDIVVMKSAEDPTAKNQFRFTSSMTNANTDNTRVKGVLVNFTSVVNNTNITFYKAWVFKKSKLTFIAANSSMMNFEKDFFNTTTLVLSKRYKGNWKKLTTMAGLNYTAGKYGDASFMNVSAIGGGFYSYNINKKISGSVLIIGVYSPFTQFYDGRWWDSSTLIVPYSTWDYKITKTFKFNVSFSGVYEMNKSMLNYQVLTGGKIMF